MSDVQNTVKDLIAFLQTFPEDQEVNIDSDIMANGLLYVGADVVWVDYYDSDPPLKEMTLKRINDAQTIVMEGVGIQDVRHAIEG